jgi:hypothetical protein
MNKRKNLLIVSGLLLLLVAFPVFASEYEPTEDPYGLVSESFEGTSTRVMGTGGAGLGVTGYYDSFLINPANLGSGGLKISLPSITVTAYNVQDILESSFFDDLEAGDSTSAATAFLQTLGSGYSDVVTTDLSMVLGLGNFGFGLQAQERLMSYNSGSDLSDTDLIAQVTVAATAGLGFRINAIPGAVSIDLGVSGKAIYKMYLEAQNANTVIDNIDDISNYYLNGAPLIAGYAFPVTVGMNINVPLGFTVSTVARNFNGTYYMTTFQSLNDWSEEVLGESFSTDTSDDSEFDSDTFSIDDGWQLDMGLTWEPETGPMFKPILALDVTDVLELSGLEGDDLTDELLENTHFGASLRLLSIVDLRYGLNSGYQSFGVGFDLLIFHLDAAYYLLEYGDSLGDNTTDAFSLRFSLLSR